MVGFYRRLIEEYGWRQEPMLEFVSWLAGSDYSRVLFPSTSHEALGLSTVATYQERLRLPMVYIVFSELRGFVVHWQRGQGDEVWEEPVPSPQAPKYLVGFSAGWVSPSKGTPNEEMTWTNPSQPNYSSR